MYYWHFQFLGNYRTHLWLITMVSSYVESNQGDGPSKKVSRDPSQNYQTMKLSYLINLSYLPSCFLVYFSVSTFTKTVKFAEGNLCGNSTHRSLSWCLIAIQTPTSSNSYSLLETPRLLEFYTCWWLRVLIHWLVQRQVGYWSHASSLAAIPNRKSGRNFISSAKKSHP